MHDMYETTEAVKKLQLCPLGGQGISGIMRCVGNGLRELFGGISASMFAVWA
jgi:hypothetical protein